jgi:hypothetical protein
MRQQCETIIVDAGPPAVRRAKPQPGGIGFNFQGSCSPIIVIVTYSCRGEGRVNGVFKPLSVTKEIRVECRKVGDVWRCG